MAAQQCAGHWRQIALKELQQACFTDADHRPGFQLKP